MKIVFADTFYYLALLNRRDDLHQQAVEVFENLVARTITTEYVLLELLDAFSDEHSRRRGVEWVETLRDDPEVSIIPCSSVVWAEGLDLYSRRLDKQWSLTDCISFVVMKQSGITEALTHDHHFKQAGFRVLL